MVDNELPDEAIADAMKTVPGSHDRHNRPRPNTVGGRRGLRTQVPMMQMNDVVLSPSNCFDNAAMFCFAALDRLGASTGLRPR
jgi:hypothetical protein